MTSMSSQKQFQRERAEHSADAATVMTDRFYIYIFRKAQNNVQGMTELIYTALWHWSHITPLSHD